MLSKIWEIWTKYFLISLIQKERISRRLKTRLPVSYEQLGGNRRFGETVTKDISSTGLRMNMNNFFATDNDFLIKLRFPEVNRIVEAIAKVIWSHRISYSDQYQAGLQFCEINPLFKKWLDEYILINETLAK